MSSWAERAKAAIAQTGQGGTAKTDETVFFETFGSFVSTHRGRS
jgi:hypothetical protein